MDEYTIKETLKQSSIVTTYKLMRKADQVPFIGRLIDYSFFTNAQRTALIQEINGIKQLKNPHLEEIIDMYVCKLESF
jgi:hypothetical protein